MSKLNADKKMVKMRLLEDWTYKGVEYLAGEVLLLEENVARKLYEDYVARLVFGFGFTFGNDPRLNRAEVRERHIQRMAKIMAENKSIGLLS